jgi:hypothetical protein
MRVFIVKKSLLNSTIMALLATASSAALAASLTVPNSFTAGNTAVAADVNANFTAVKTAVDDNDGRITTNAADIATNATAIAGKADTTTVNTALGLKADTAAVNTALGLKADTTAVNTALGLKADTTTVNTALGLKADTTTVTANTADIATNATGIATNVTAIATNATAIATNATAITALQAANTCPSDMVAAGTLCVDKYEASVYSDVSLTTIIAGANINTACSQDGSDCSVGAASPIYAGSVAGVMPSFDITYYQAAIACANVGKRLPTISEWQMAAAGTPTGQGDGTTGCNGSASLNTTGLAGANCKSTAGAFDMVGNVYELTADLVFPAATIGVGDTQTDTDTARVLAMGDDYNGTGALHSIKSAVATGPSDIGNSTTGFRCVK